MPDIFDLFARWWKQIAGLVIVTVGITAAFVYSKHKQYLAVSTALPAPTYAVDKAGVFSQNMQTLYPGVGTPDDLDMILGTSHLDTVYNSVADRLGLADYYGIDKNDAEAIKKAGSILKGKTRTIKSDYGELKVKVWDGNRSRAADMSNAIMEKLKEMHQDVQMSNNKLILAKIKEVYPTLDSLPQEKQEYARLLSQYQLMATVKPEALIIIERASAPLWPDKPKPVQTMLAAALLSLFFGILVALVLERRRMAKK